MTNYKIQKSTYLYPSLKQPLEDYIKRTGQYETDFFDEALNELMDHEEQVGSLGEIEKEPRIAKSAHVKITTVERLAEHLKTYPRAEVNFFNHAIKFKINRVYGTEQG